MAQTGVLFVAKIVNVVAVADNPAVPVTIKEWKVTDELKVALVGQANLINLNAMIDGGAGGFLVFADKEQFGGEREPIKPAPDQGDLLDDEHDEDGVVFDNTDAGGGTTATVQFGDGPEVPFPSPEATEEMTRAAKAARRRAA